VEVNKDSPNSLSPIRRDGRFSMAIDHGARLSTRFAAVFTPEVGSRNAAHGLSDQYAEPSTRAACLCFDPKQQDYLLEKDFADSAEKTYAPADPLESSSGNEKKRQKELDANQS